MKNHKAFILGLYFVALFIILRHWYNQPANSGMPYPTTITAPSYLYAVLGLTGDFLGGLSTVLAAGLTLGLYYATQKKGPLQFAVSAAGTTTTTSKAVGASGGLTAGTPPKKKVKTK